MKGMYIDRTFLRNVHGQNKHYQRVRMYRDILFPLVGMYRVRQFHKSMT